VLLNNNIEYKTDNYGEIIDMTNQNIEVFNNTSYNMRNIKKLRL